MTRTTIRSEDITAGQVKSADLASDAVDTTSLETDIALLGFKVAANGSMAAYNLKDQTVDAFEDASGIDASGSTNESRNASNYYSGSSESIVTAYTDSLPDNGTGWSNYSARGLLTLTAGGTEVRVDLKGGNDGTTLDNVAIVERSGSTWSGTETPTEITFSGSSGVDIGSNATVTSDWITFSTTASTDYLGILDFANSGNFHVGWNDAGGIGLAYNSNTNSYNVASFSPSYSSTTQGIAFAKVEVKSQSVDNLTLVSNATTASSTPTTGDIVMTYTNGAGTATVNTDLKAYISRDNGTTWTQATLSSEGTTGGHTILTAHNVDISSQPSGTSMRYKITTHNQSASKETRIQAVSLGWS